MPPRQKEERRRGKKRKKVPDEANKSKSEQGADAVPTFFIDRQGANEEEQDEEESKPSWLLEKPVAGSSSASKIEASTPFGLVELDLKAYLRTMHLKLEEFMEAALAEGRAFIEDEEVKTVRDAMLDEIKGKELTLATDGDTSRILEDMLTCFSARQVRILADALAKDEGDLEKLACHRFGSHLLQSTLVALQETSSQEEKDALSNKKSKGVFGENGNVLRSAQQLVLDIASYLSARSSDLLPDAFGTHVLRTLVLVLAGKASFALEYSRRSKKSKLYKQKVQSSVVAKGDVAQEITIPDTFKEALSLLFKSTLIHPASEVLRLCRDAVAAPTLSVIIEIATAKQNDDPRSKEYFLDAILGSSAEISWTNQVDDLMKDEVGSHVLQSLLKYTNKQIVLQFWIIYIKGQLCKLGSHPIANFIVATVVKRIGEFDEEFVTDACREVQLAGGVLVKQNRIGILIALIGSNVIRRQVQNTVKMAPNEMMTIQKQTDDVWSSDSIPCKASRAILAAFGFDKERVRSKDEDKSLLVKVLMSGKTRKSYQKEIIRAQSEMQKETAKSSRDDLEGEENGKHDKEGDEQDLLMSTQGSLLCQSMLNLGEIASAPLVESILSLPSLLPICNNPTTVHILLAPFQPDSQSSFTHRKALSAKVVSELSDLLNDKFGSRVIDLVFDRSDSFFKEKIVKKCIEEERQILVSNYGRYFLRRVDISLFRKNVNQWKHKMASKKIVNEMHEASEISTDVLARPEKKQKLKSQAEKELDSILAGI